jgi:hypothetical protein
MNSGSSQLSKRVKAVFPQQGEMLSAKARLRIVIVISSKKKKCVTVCVYYMQAYIK